VARKKVLINQDFVATSFWCKVVAVSVYALVVIGRACGGGMPEIRDGGALFGIQMLHFSPPVTFLVYLVIDALLSGCAILLYFRALQVSPLSLCMPFMAFTPVFLLPTGFVLVGELPSTVKIIGVVLVVVGSLAMHRQLFATGPWEPVKAIIREKGSRYMLIVAFIFSVTNPLDKKLVLMSHAFTQALAYGALLCVMFAVWALARKADLTAPIRTVPWWIVIAGIGEAVVLLLQFTSHNYIDVVITISLKRAGIVLAVLMGWLIFREKEITDKVIGSSVMVAGALMFYLPLGLSHATVIAGGTIVGMAIALYATGKPAMSRPQGM
jgi:uncharacterized membrane protein